MAKSASTKNSAALEAFLLPLNVVDYDAGAAMIYGDIRATLEKQGKTIGPLDMLIAASALSCQLILVTNNEQEFRRISKLKVENWL